MTSKDVMVIEDVAELLSTPVFVVDKLVSSGDLPAEKVGGSWRFHRRLVEDWLAAATSENSRQLLIPQTETAAARLEFTDLDEHAATVGPLDLNLEQLSAGTYYAEMDSVSLPGMQVFAERWTHAVKGMATMPEGAIVLGTNVGWQRSQTRWFNQTLNVERFGCAGPGAEINYLLPEGGHNAVLVVDPELLLSATDAATVEKLCTSRCLNTTALAGSRLLAAITAVAGKYTKHPQLLDIPGEVNALRSALLEAVADAVGDDSRLTSTSSKNARELVIGRAIKIIDKSTTPITVLELAQSAGVSIRSLEYAFRASLDISPSAYLRLHRLNRVRRELLAADPEVNTVSAVASRWGFADPGRFSMAYRALFEEKPSHTLRKPAYMNTSRYIIPAKTLSNQ